MNLCSTIKQAAVAGDVYCVNGVLVVNRILFPGDYRPAGQQRLIKASL